jgi:ABC-type nitrate/sulfonate/bicarbonate transport system substrate-binding protein
MLSMASGEARFTSHPLSRRRLLQLTATSGLSAAAASLQACAPVQQPAPSGAPAAAPIRSIPRVRFVNTQGGLGDWAPYVALEKKYFEEVGVEVELTHLGSGPAVTNAIIGGQADTGISSIPAVVSAVLNGAPLKLCMATQMALPGHKYNSWWCSLPGSPILKVADLKGKKVHIFSANSLAQMTTRTVLRQHGVMPGEYEELSFTFDQAYTAIKTGRADVALFVEPFWTNSNKLARQEYGNELQIVYSQLDAFPAGMHLSGMMSNTSFMAQNGEALHRFHQAQARAAQWGQANPEEIKPIIAKYAGVPYDNIKDMIIADQSVDGRWLPGFLRQLQEYMIVEKTVEALTEPLPDERLVETAYLPTS